MAIKNKTFRLSERHIASLEILAEAYGMSTYELIPLLINQKYRRLYESNINKIK